jgi:hypothetical protein
MGDDMPRPTGGRVDPAHFIFFNKTTCTIGVLFLVVLAGAALLFLVPGIKNLLPAGAQPIGLLCGFVLSIVFAVLPILICLVQTTTKARQLARLNTLRRYNVASTMHFRTAYSAIEGIQPVEVANSDYRVPMLTFSSVILVACLMTFMSSYALSAFDHPNLFLSGLRFLPADEVTRDMARLGYQQGTFVVASMAFLGCYVYTLGRLLDRLNNHDLSPISFYYYSARVIISVVSAVVLRHSADALGVDQTPALLLLGFATGLAPDLFILAMARKAFQSVKVFGSKGDPDDDVRPTAMPLAMLDDLTKEKIDRIGELSVDSAQALSRQNPLVLWLRLPYDLTLVVDWIAQAQLYAFAREGGLHKLRAICVSDIFDLHVRLTDETARGAACAALGVDALTAPALLRQLEDDQSFTRLKEVRDAMLPGAVGQRLPKPAPGVSLVASR